MLCRQVMQEILTQLRRILGGTEAGQQPVFLWDGSSLESEHCQELVRAYSPAQNQPGQSHWPVVRMVVLHDVKSGLAEEQSWGPMYGPEAVSEQALVRNNEVLSLRCVAHRRSSSCKFFEPGAYFHAIFHANKVEVETAHNKWTTYEIFNSRQMETFYGHVTQDSWCFTSTAT